MKEAACLKSDDNYTTLLLKNARLSDGAGKKAYGRPVFKRNGRNTEQHSFIRVHCFYLVNLDEIEKYIKGEGGYLVMSDGTSIDVAKNKKEVLLKKLIP